MPTAQAFDVDIQRMRRFNRFYTQKIGVLQEGLLDSPFSLTEVRVLYELANGKNLTASQMNKTLDLDVGYLSRILRNFEKRGLVERATSKTDGRANVIKLTPAGLEAFRPLNDRSSNQVRLMLNELSQEKRKQLVEAMNTIENLLSDKTPPAEPFVLRPHQPGDMGWVVHRQGYLYAHEYGWSQEFEALVAEIAAQFIRNFDPKCERCWIAEMNDEIVGSVFVVRESDTVAKLRLLYVEPKARGMGIGDKLVRECIKFSRQTGYKKIILWTNDILHAARKIYERAGFKLVEENKHHSFGHDLVGQTWELDLT
ncbi:MAG TPA: helix-turn-helix domain-containing GNAT family N-acetyltransferase [Oculatellaceae cyanobacterium]